MAMAGTIGLTIGLAACGDEERPEETGAEETGAQELGAEDSSPEVNLPEEEEAPDEVDTPVETEPVETETEGTGAANTTGEGTLVIDVTSWAEDRMGETETLEFPVIEGQEYEIIPDSAWSTTFQINEVGSDSVTFTFDGYYYAGEDGPSENPEFTLYDSWSTTFETASDDGGYYYDVTYQPDE